MIRCIVSSFLVFLLLVNMSAVSLLQLAYQANKAYFIRNFCENKNKPQLRCEGKCHLKKTIKKIAGNENGTKENHIFSFAVEYLPAAENNPFLENRLLVKTFHLLPVNRYLYLFSSLLIKPPSA